MYIQFVHVIKKAKYRLPLPWEKVDFCHETQNLVSNLIHNYRKMNRGLHDIPLFLIFDAGKE